MSHLCLNGAGPTSGSDMVASLRNGLTAYWKLEESSGTRVDSGPNAQDLTANGAPGNTTGVIGNCVDLNGSSQYLSRAAGATINLGDIDFTWCCWVKFGAAGDDEIISKYGPGGGGNGFLIAKSSFFSDKMLFQGYNAGVSIGYVLSAAAMSTGTWYFICAWHDAAGNTVNLSIDDGATQTGATILAGTDSGAAFGVGARASGPSIYTQGQIDEVGFWKRILTAAERTALKNLTVPY